MQPLQLSRRRCLALGAGAALIGIAREAHAAGAVPRSAGPFRFHADGSLAGFESLVAELGRLQDDLTAMLEVPRAQEPVDIVLFRTETAYRNYLRAQLPGVPYRRALFVKGAGPGRIITFMDDELAVNLRHEGTHALLHAALAMVPLWLDEGLAEYFELPAADRAHRHPHQAKVQWHARLGIGPRLATLEAKRELAELSAADYRAAWAWVHFLLHGPAPARSELVQLLADIRGAVPPGLMSHRLQRSLPGADRLLVEHFRAWPA